VPPNAFHAVWFGPGIDQQDHAVDGFHIVLKAPQLALLGLNLALEVCSLALESLKLEYVAHSASMEKA
jgi:hypothetical protein